MADTIFNTNSRLVVVEKGSSDNDLRVTRVRTIIICSDREAAPVVPKAGISNVMCVG